MFTFFKCFTLWAKFTKFPKFTNKKTLFYFIFLKIIAFKYKSATVEACLEDENVLFFHFKKF